MAEGAREAQEKDRPDDPDVLLYETFPPGCEIKHVPLAGGGTLVVVRQVRLDNPQRGKQNRR